MRKDDKGDQAGSFCHDALTREVKDLFVRTTMATERKILDARSESSNKHDQLIGLMHQFARQQSDLRSDIASSRVEISEVKRTALTPEQVKAVVTDGVSVIGVGIATVIGLIVTILALVLT